MKIFKINAVDDGRGDVCCQLPFKKTTYFTIMLFWKQILRIRILDQWSPTRGQVVVHEVRKVGDLCSR